MKVDKNSYVYSYSTIVRSLTTVWTGIFTEHNSMIWPIGCEDTMVGTV